jgi:hypothetical protein
MYGGKEWIVSQLPDNDGIVHSGKELALNAIDLTDEEVAKSVSIVYELQQKYATRAFTEANLDALRDEVLTRLAEVGVLATFDPAPCLHGEPPVVEFLGKVSGDKTFHTEGLDHERKQWEVLKAKERGEDYYGQKGKNA